MSGNVRDSGTTFEMGMNSNTDLGEFWGDFLKYASDAKKKFRIV